MKEKIAEWLHSWIIKDRKASMPWLEEMPWYTLEPDTQERWREKADEILSLLKEEIKKVGNPHVKAYKIGESEDWTSTPEYRGFEDCRQAVLKALES